MAQIDYVLLKVLTTIGCQVTGGVKHVSHITKDGSHHTSHPIQSEPHGFLARINSICIVVTKQRMVPAAAHKIAAYPFIMGSVLIATQKYPIGQYTQF